MKNLDFKNKKVAVLGMGIEGLSLVDFLSKKECDISVLDKLTKEEILKNFSTEEAATFNRFLADDNIVKIFGDHYLKDINTFDIIFRSPGISFYNPKIQEAKKRGVEISSQIKLFFDLCPCKIVGVTGTKGKGTTSSLIFEILKNKYQNPNNKLQIKAQNINSKNQDNFNLETTNLELLPNIYLAGNIGYPAITLLSNINSADIVILELSSFQLMDLEISPHIAVVTNLYVDHLNYHQDIKEYHSAKESVIKFQTESDFSVLNTNSTFDNNVIQASKSTKKYFSNTSDGSAVIIDNTVVLDPKNRNLKICNLSEIKLFGHHNLENIAAATLVADILDIDSNIISNTVKNFKGLPHRLEFVAEINGIKFINDSYATNPEPTIAAINSFAESKVLVLGGSSKEADFSLLANKIAHSNIKGIILIGDEAKRLDRALITASYNGQKIKGLVDIDEIVNAAFKIASSGDIVLMSPACASFGMFKNYKDRGEKFKTSVSGLISRS